MSGYELLRSAVREQRQVVAGYQGYRREFCPHILGTKAGKARVLAYQFGGETSGGPIASPHAGEWRCFEVDKLVDLELREGEWYTAATNRARQRCVDSIDIEVE